MNIDEKKIPLYLKYIMIDYYAFLNGELRDIIDKYSFVWQQEICKALKISEVRWSDKISLGLSTLKFTNDFNYIMYSMPSDTMEELIHVYDWIIRLFLNRWDNLNKKLRFKFMIEMMKIKTMVMVITRMVKQCNGEELHPNKFLDTGSEFLLVKCFDTLSNYYMLDVSEIEENIAYSLSYISKSTSSLTYLFPINSLIDMSIDTIRDWIPDFTNLTFGKIKLLYDNYMEVNVNDYINDALNHNFNIPVKDNCIFERLLMHDRMSKIEDLYTEAGTMIDMIEPSDKKSILFGDDLTPAGINSGEFIDKVMGVTEENIREVEREVYHPLLLRDFGISFSISESDKEKIQSKYSLKICTLVSGDKIHLESRVVIEYDKNLYLLYKSKVLDDLRFFKLPLPQ